MQAALAANIGGGEGMWDEQDGYAMARLAGWEISEAAKCPQCVAKLVLVQ